MYYFIDTQGISREEIETFSNLKEPRFSSLRNFSYKSSEEVLQLSTKDTPLFPFPHLYRPRFLLTRSQRLRAASPLFLQTYPFDHRFPINLNIASAENTGHGRVNRPTILTPDAASLAEEFFSKFANWSGPSSRSKKAGINGGGKKRKNRESVSRRRARFSTNFFQPSDTSPVFCQQCTCTHTYTHRNTYAGVRVRESSGKKW